MDQEEIRKNLLKEKEELELMIEDLEREGRELIVEQVKTPDEEADKYEFKQEYHIQIENFKQRLEKINKALKKIDSGEYGICEKCGKKIEEARLKIDLAVELCRDCAFNL